jgi:hypothetical protein
MNIDLFEKIRTSAEQDAVRMVREANLEFKQPQLDRDDLVEHKQLTPEQKIALFQQVGAQKFSEYERYMAKLEEQTQQGG